jgi:hypothetical protein
MRPFGARARDEGPARSLWAAILLRLGQENFGCGIPRWVPLHTAHVRQNQLTHFRLGMSENAHGLMNLDDARRDAVVIPPWTNSSSRSSQDGDLQRAAAGDQQKNILEHVGLGQTRSVHAISATGAANLLRHVLMLAIHQRSSSSRASLEPVSVVFNLMQEPGPSRTAWL